MDGKPKLTGECTKCGLCAKTCPQYQPSTATLENFVFKRQRNPDEPFGVHRQIVVAQTTNPTIRQTCQDGGAITTLLLFALKTNTIDAAAVTGTHPTTSFYPVPTVATTPQQILQSAGTKYSLSPTLLAFQKAVQQNKQKIAVVGTPCQIHALRNLQLIPIKTYADNLTLTIGLLCSGAFSYHGLIQHYIKRKLGVNPENIEKLNIKGKLLVTTTSGETKTAPLEKIRPYLQEACTTCPDFAAEFADISIGGLGLTGWSLVITRTEIGEQLFNSAVNAHLLKVHPLRKEHHPYRLLVALSTKRRNRQPDPPASSPPPRQ